MKSFISLKNISKKYSQKNEETIALENISLDISEGQFVSIVGPSGCGKSTLINILAGFLPFESGEVIINNVKVNSPSNDRAVVFQEDAVFPWYNVFDNIAYGLKIRGKSKIEIDTIASNYINLVGLSSFKSFYPKQLSGGMKKRVDLARAYANNPSILLMDEPFGALDVMTRQNMQLKLLELLELEKKTVIFVTHDISEAIVLSDKVVIMDSLPGSIKEIVDVKFIRPRTLQLKKQKDFLDLHEYIEKKVIHNLP
jgi:NitT/TauT family transport system ATP-binding protein